MKQIMTLLIIQLIICNASAQETNTTIPTHFVEPIKFRCSGYEFPAHIDSSLFAMFINGSLNPERMPIAIRPAEGFSIEMRYIISKEGKVVEVSSTSNKKNELIDYITQKLLSCPYQWSPAYRNGRAVKSFHRIKIVFSEILNPINYLPTVFS